MKETAAMGNTLAVLVVILGGVLVLLPVVLTAIVTGPTLHTDEFRHKGFGDNWSRREYVAFFLSIFLAGTRGRYWLPGSMVAGSLLLAFGGAALAHASPPVTLLAEGIALVGSSLLWWLYWFKWVPHRLQRTIAPPPLTPATAPPPLRFNTPYTLGKVSITIQAVRKRQPFHPRTSWRSPGGNLIQLPRGYILPLTWFVEFDCLLHNSARKDVTIWTQLEEIVPETAEPHVPHLWYQFPPLSEDETADDDPHIRHPLSGSRYTIAVHESVASKLFFRFDETHDMHTVAFTLHASRRNELPWEERLFIVEV